jgi:hypothetical protein
LCKKKKKSKKGKKRKIERSKDIAKEWWRRDARNKRCCCPWLKDSSCHIFNKAVQSGTGFPEEFQECEG